MEPLLPSEVARLVFGYLKKEKNEDAAEHFLKSSPHLTECYKMFKNKKNFNLKVNGFNLYDIFDIFGTMCSMINERISEAYESKTLIEQLQYLLDANHKPAKEDKCIETELNVVDKCTGCTVSTENKSTLTNKEANSSTSEVLENPTFTEIISSNVSETNEIDTINNKAVIIGVENNKKINESLEKNIITCSSPCSNSTPEVINNNASTQSSEVVDEESPIFQIHEQLCSTPAKIIEETKNSIEATLQFSPKNIHNQNQLHSNQPECQQIPEATSLESMPGLSKGDKSKDSSVVIDTGELVDTFLNDQSLLEKIADTINKSIETQRESDDSIQNGNVLDPPTLEKALDSTRSDPQIKNILDEFLVFNVDNSDDGKKKCSNEKSSIKSRLRSAKKHDDAPCKSKKNNFYIPKHFISANDDSKKSDCNILLVHEGNIKTVFESCDMISNQILLQPNNSNVEQFNFDITGMGTEEEYNGKANYVRIAPKMTPMLKTHQVPEKHIFPKRTRRSIEQFGIRSKFKRTNLSMTPTEIIQPPQSIVIEVPDQSIFENQAKSNLDANIIRLPDMNKESSKVKDVIGKSCNTHDTPDDRQIPAKTKSMSTPRRRSTHIRCLDFSTPQPKSKARDQARSKLFCDTPKRCEKILEESISSPLPKLQADWGSVNGFESIVKKENTKYWDTDIREMVGAGILTSDADGRKTKKKKTPRKKIKPVNDKNNSELLLEKQNKSNNNSIQSNESLNNVTIKSNTSENQFNINEDNCNKPLLDEQKLLKEKPNEIPISLETSDKIVTDLFSEQLSNKSDTFTNINNLKSLKPMSEYPHPLETPSKILTELFDEQPLNKSESLKNIDNLESLNNQSKFPISLETPNKIMKLCIEKLSIKSDSLKSLDDSKSLKSLTEFPISLETPCKTTEVCNEQPTIENNYSKSPCNIQNNPLLLESNINDPENHLNQLNTVAKEATISSISKTAPETINISQKTETNFLKTFNSHNCLNPLSMKFPESKSNEPTENVKKQTLQEIETSNSSQLNSPVKHNIQPVKKKIFETPYKCDDAAVDVPETPITKLLREYDPSKLMTPLPSTPVHFEDSLSETPLTKVFRETSYLNRPPISPFPPTPGNSRSVDTLIVQPEQVCTNVLKQYLEQPIMKTTIKNENPTSAKKVKSTPFKTKTKLSDKKKIKNVLKEKSVEAKKKQVYESVKVELFGTEITSNSSGDELENTKTKPKKIVINKKNQGAEKKSGFKPIPQRKSMPHPSSLVNGLENHSLNEINTSIKPAIVQKNKSNVEKINKISNTTQLNKSKKSMVHFDDPVEQCINLSTKSRTSKSNSAVNKIENKTVINDSSEPLVGLSRYLNQPSSFYDGDDKKKIRSAEKIGETSKLTNSGSNINYSKIYNEIKSSENISKISQCFLMNKTKTNEISEQKNESSKSCTVLGNKKNNNKSCSPMDSVQSTSIYTKTTEQDCVSKNKTNNTSIQKSDSSVNNSTINTSCITIGHDDELKKVYNSINNMEYLKAPKVYEVITDDGEHRMVSLTLTEPFSLLDIPSELNNEQPLNSNSSSFIMNKELDVTPEVEVGELGKDDSPVTSTPKDTIVKNEEKNNRFRRSPSFWEDSVHNYPVKHREDRYRESNSWRNNKYDKKYRQNSWHQFGTFNRSSQRSHHVNMKKEFRDDGVRDHHVNIKKEFRDDGVRDHHVNIKKEFRDDGVRDKDRFKHKFDKRRSYRDDRKGRDRLDESERFSVGQRLSQNESQKPSRADDIVKKATKRPANRTDHNEIPPKTSKVEHQRLLKNINVDDFLSVVHGQK